MNFNLSIAEFIQKFRDESQTGNKLQSNNIEVAVEVGDHLESPRRGYSHHGIYIGDDQVIHYSGFANGMSKGAIEITTLNDFCSGKGFKTVSHGKRMYSKTNAVGRAHERLGEDWYSLLGNNCEHFVNWCIHGKHSSPQIHRVAGVVSILVAGAVANNPRAKKAVIHAITTMADKTTRDQFGRKIVKAASRYVARNTASAATADAGFAAATGSVAVTALDGRRTAVSLSTIAVPVAAVLAVGYGIWKLWDVFD